MLKNLEIHIGVLILFCLGFFLIPNQSYACSKNSTKTEQSACSKKQTARSEHKDCCKAMHHKKCNGSKDCGGNCKGNSCRCVPSTTSLSVPAIIGLKINDQFADAKKQKFGFKQAHYSSGFYSIIWLPPKIS